MKRRCKLFQEREMRTGAGSVKREKKMNSAPLGVGGWGLGFGFSELRKKIAIQAKFG
jgi:hypothetical protein